MTIDADRIRTQAESCLYWFAADMPAARMARAVLALLAERDALRAEVEWYQRRTRLRPHPTSDTEPEARS